MNHSPAEGNTCDGHGNTLKEATVKGYMSNRPQAVDPQGVWGYIPRDLQVFFL